MKAKTKKKIKDICQIEGCKREWICGVYPKGKMLKTLFVCHRHLCRHHDPEDVFCFYKIWKLSKPVKIVRIIQETKKKKEPDQQPKWQLILERWFNKGKYPSHKYMNVKRWQYWFSIGGKKPEGNSHKFEKKNLKAKIQRKK